MSISGGVSSRPPAAETPAGVNGVNDDVGESWRGEENMA